MTYHGFNIVRSNGRGGKAGKGRNKTASVQVREPLRGTAYLLVKQFRYGAGCGMMAEAMTKAVEHVDAIIEHRSRYANASAN
jgi:hypothetical protein